MGDRVDISLQQRALESGHTGRERAVPCVDVIGIVPCGSNLTMDEIHGTRTPLTLGRPSIWHKVVFITYQDEHSSANPEGGAIVLDLGMR